MGSRFPGERRDDQDPGHSTVTVQASNVSFTAKPGETVFAAAARHGYVWPSICGGKADCTRCLMEVVDGVERLSPMEAAEREALQRVRRLDTVCSDRRLACCAGVLGNVTVRRRSVRRRGEGEVA